MKKLFHAPLIGALLVGATMAIAPVPAFAQDDDIVVTSHGFVPDYVQRLSMRVSYSDLNLNRAADRQELRDRVWDAATNLCRRLDEANVGDNGTPTCMDWAYRDAMQRIGTYKANYAPRPTTWIGRAGR